MVRRILSLSLLLLGRSLAPALLLLEALPAAAQRGAVYCNVTAITSEQVSNGVRVTIQADGDLQWEVDWRQLIEEGAAEGEIYDDYGMSISGFTERFRRLPIRLRNARSKLGSAFVPINKYPISHAEIYIPEWAHEGVGLEVDVVNYLGWITGEGDLQRFRGEFDYQSSEDSSAIVITWESDRFPPPPPPKTPEDLPTELDVAADGDLLTLRAVNAKLQDVTNAIARKAGFPVTAPPDDDLRVSLYLADITPARALDAIAVGCGLCTQAGPGGGWIIARPTGTAGGYAASGSRRVPLRYLRAVDAVDLLPNFLIEHLHPDEESNTVVVTGPEYLLDRVAQDLAKLDLPPPEVTIEAVAVEYTSAESLSRDLRLERFADDFGAGFEPLTGDLRFLWLDGLPKGWDLLLDSLEVKTSTRLRSRTTLRVLNGHQASISAGQERYMILERLSEHSAFYLEHIGTLNMLSVQPLVGSTDQVFLRLAVVVRSLSGTDPKTGLPIFSLRRANGGLRVRDGDTIVLAGLHMQGEGREDRAIPVLGSLPFVGGLFRAPDRSRSATQLAFFITPHIVRTSLAPQGETNDG